MSKKPNENKITLDNLNQHFVTNAMTMQTALETAYNDWNKQKTPSSNTTQAGTNETPKETEVKTETKPNNLNEVTLTNMIVDEIDPKSNKTESELKADDSITSEMPIPFYCGNPTVDIVKGFLHIYKEHNLIPLDDIESSKKEVAPSFKDVQLRSEMVCMIGIPASIGCNELLEFIMPK